MFERGYLKIMFVKNLTFFLKFKIFPSRVFYNRKL